MMDVSRTQAYVDRRRKLFTFFTFTFKFSCIFFSFRSAFALHTIGVYRTLAIEIFLFKVHDNVI